MRAIVAMLLMLSLAGCADSTPVMVADDFSDEFDEQLQATAETGVIRGVVVDETITPIADARVVLVGQDQETTTNEKGEFGFADLEPGAYFLKASKIAFNTVQQSVEVVAGVDKPPVVRILIESDPSSLPFTELLTFEGYLQCGVGLGAISASTNPCAFTGSVNTFDSFADSSLNMTQIEMVWRGTNVFGDGLSVGILRPGTLANYAQSDGPSPRILPVDGDKIRSENGEEFESYLIRVFPGTNQPVSVVVEQKFTIYDTHFYGFAADEGWAFITDGEHPIPGQ